MQTGGDHQHTLTTAEMPSHSHSYEYPGIFGASAGTGNYYGRLPGGTGPAGGNQPHENCPPFYALAFIMKL
jgi:microcystin-dependent protein